jgi:membrane complex biogenesis BtpA family protein
MDHVLSRAVRDAGNLAEGGVAGLLVENFGDIPFFPGRVPPETVAALAVAVSEISRGFSLPVGVNVLRNDAEAAVAIAACTGARFIRVNVHTGVMFTDQGLVQGRASQTLRKRAALGSPVAILADIMVKHATPPSELTVEAAARDTWARGMVDGLILTGTETGKPLEAKDLQRARAVLPPDAKLWVGSGANPKNIANLMEVAEGFIVGSAFQVGGVAGSGVDPDRVKAFMEEYGRRGCAT